MKELFLKMIFDKMRVETTQKFFTTRKQLTNQVKKITLQRKKHRD